MPSPCRSPSSRRPPAPSTPHSTTCSWRPRSMRSVAYHEAAGAECTEVRMNMPVSVRGGASEHRFDNQFVPTRMVLPLTVAARAERIAEVKDLLRAVRAEPALPHVNDISGVISRLGPGASVSGARRDVEGRRHHHLQRAGATVPSVHGRREGRESSTHSDRWRARRSTSRCSATTVSSTSGSTATDQQSPTASGPRVPRDGSETACLRRPSRGPGPSRRRRPTRRRTSSGTLARIGSRPGSEPRSTCGGLAAVSLLASPAVNARLRRAQPRDGANAESMSLSADPALQRRCHRHAARHAWRRHGTRPCQ